MLNDLDMNSDPTSAKPVDPFKEVPPKNNGKRNAKEVDESNPKKTKLEIEPPIVKLKTPTGELSFEVSDDEENSDTVNKVLKTVQEYFCKHCQYNTADLMRLVSHYEDDHPYIQCSPVYIEEKSDQNATFRCLECPVEFSKKKPGSEDDVYHSFKMEESWASPVSDPEDEEIPNNCNHRARWLKKQHTMESKLSEENNVPSLNPVKEETVVDVRGEETVISLQDSASGLGPESPEVSEEKSSDGKHVCQRCKRSFSSLKGLRSHERSHAALAAFDSAAALDSQEHIDEYITYRTGTTRPFMCIVCSYRTTVMSLAKNHLIKKHPRKSLNPAKVDKHFDEFRLKDNEASSNALDDVYAADEDEPENSYLEPPDVQRQLKHYSVMAQVDPASKAQHFQLSDPRMLPCEMCNFNCQHYSAMRRHYLRRHGKKLIRCKNCNFFSCFKQNLELHEQMGHSTLQSEPTHQKNLCCPFCLYQSKNKNNMIDHIVLHREERVMPIEVRSGTAESLNLHMAKHNDLKPFKCRLCYFDCTQLKDLEAHLCDKHQVVRNHQLVGQVSLDQLEATRGMISQDDDDEDDDYDYEMLDNTERGAPTMKIKKNQENENKDQDVEENHTISDNPKIQTIPGQQSEDIFKHSTNKLNDDQDGNQAQIKVTEDTVESLTIQNIPGPSLNEEFKQTTNDLKYEHDSLAQFKATADLSESSPTVIEDQIESQDSPQNIEANVEIKMQNDTAENEDFSKVDCATALNSDVSKTNSDMQNPLFENMPDCSKGNMTAPSFVELSSEVQKSQDKMKNSEEDSSYGEMPILEKYFKEQSLVYARSSETSEFPNSVRNVEFKKESSEAHNTENEACLSPPALLSLDTAVNSPVEANVFPCHLCGRSLANTSDLEQKKMSNLNIPKEEGGSLSARIINIVFIILVLDLLGFTLILPLFPSILDHYSQEEDKVYQFMQSAVDWFRESIRIPLDKKYNSVLFGGLIGSLFSLLQFLSSPVTGALSDRYGRRPLLIVTTLGLIFSYAVWAFSRNFTMFLLFRIIGGICKGNVSLCTAIVADLPCPKARNKGMAMIGIAFSLGFTVGPLMGAYFAMSSRTSGLAVFHQAPALLALTFSVADLLFIWLVLPETLGKDVKMSGSGHYRDLLNPLALVCFSAINSSKDDPSTQRMKKLRRLGLVYFCYLFLFSGLEFTLSFLTHQRFKFTSMQQGKMFFFIGIVMALIQGGYARRIKPGKHIRNVQMAMVTLIPAFLLIGFSWNLTMLYFGLALYSFAAAIVVPCLSTLVSDYGSVSQKGTVMGILRSLGALARAMGPVVSSTVYWGAGAKICFLLSSSSKRFRDYICGSDAVRKNVEMNEESDLPSTTALVQQSRRKREPPTNVALPGPYRSNPTSRGNYSLLDSSDNVANNSSLGRHGHKPKARMNTIGQKMDNTGVPFTKTSMGNPKSPGHGRKHFKRRETETPDSVTFEVKMDEFPELCGIFVDQPATEHLFQRHCWEPHTQHLEGNSDMAWKVNKNTAATNYKPPQMNVVINSSANATAQENFPGSVTNSWANIASQPPKKPVSKETTAPAHVDAEAQQEKEVTTSKRKRRKKKKKTNGADEDMETGSDKNILYQSPPRFEDEEEFPGLTPFNATEKPWISSKVVHQCNNENQRQHFQQSPMTQKKDNTQSAKSTFTESTKVQKAEKVSGKKSKVPVQLDIGNMLATLEKKQSQKAKQDTKPLKLSVGGGLPVVPKQQLVQKKPVLQGKIAHNPLDSTSPLVKKGKQREVPKAKKPTALKKVILKEREERKQRRLLEERGELPQCMSVRAEEEAEDDYETSAADETISPVEELGDSFEINDEEKPSQELSNSPTTITHTDRLKIHSRKFREYCTQMLSKDVDECVTTLLKELVRFQDRLYQKDPMKARMKRRIVMGLREVLKHLKLRKVKCVIISPNCERSQAKGGLDEALHTIIDTCREQEVPFIFALSRRALGRCVNKVVPVSLVGIFNFDGAQVSF
ncbi:hypothetical protein WMY93_005254 [Mugilogobius chulae]|uniref:Uncharacterized protein n=1 Tax=Mugilogobius chulae TaxID=88201 RepID=A0AAW0PTE9_9GOBI